MKAVVKPSHERTVAKASILAGEDDALKPININHKSSGSSDAPCKNKKVVIFDDEISFEDGKTVIINKTIDEGQFSSVFVARDVTRVHTTATSNSSKKKKNAPTLYALKRIDYNGESDSIRKEVAIHRMFPHHENIMPILGVKCSTSCCYMLFPYIPLSLRNDITFRRLLEDTCETKRRPYSEPEALTLFSGVVRAVQTLQDVAGLSHRDIKPENVLLQKNRNQNKKKKKRRQQNHVDTITPVLTDFGSAGPLTVPLHSWKDVLRATEDAAKHTTTSYCAPELCGGNLEFGPSMCLHYGYADVWCLGCLLFAMLYGTSPFEMEWSVSLVEGAAAEGTVRIVDASSTVSKIICGTIPFPPAGSAAERRYGEDVKDLIQWMLNKVGRERPSCAEVAERVDALLGKENVSGGSKRT